jgi:hypothetical protein
MQTFFVSPVTVAILIVLLILGGAVSRVNENISGPPRVSIVHKNQISPTLKELGQKAGDSAETVAPKNGHVFDGRHTGEWI